MDSDVYSEAVLVLRDTEPEPIVTSLLLLPASLEVVDEDDMVEVVVGGVAMFVCNSALLWTDDSRTRPSVLDLSVPAASEGPPLPVPAPAAEGTESPLFTVESNILVMSLAVSSR